MLHDVLQLHARHDLESWHFGLWHCTEHAARSRFCNSLLRHAALCGNMRHMTAGEARLQAATALRLAVNGDWVLRLPHHD
jgi:hypothetical protein